MNAINATPKATAEMKSFVRSLRGPHETLEAIENGHAAVRAAGDDKRAVVAAIFLTHRSIANIESHEVADAIIARSFKSETPVEMAVAA